MIDICLLTAYYYDYNIMYNYIIIIMAIPHAGDWLNVVPSQALGLHLQDWEFRVSLQYWLGLQIADEGTPCPICRTAVDPHGDHQVGCGGNGDRIHRHDSIRDAIFSAAQPAALDVTVISTLQQLTLEGAASTQGHALSVGKERKMTAHSEACRSVGVIFLPLVMESLGGWDGEAADIIRAIGRLQGQRLGIPLLRPLAIFSNGWLSPSGGITLPSGLDVYPHDPRSWTGSSELDKLMYFL